MRRRANDDRIEHLHAHFAHDPALVGLLAARLTGLTFSFTAHARDLLQIPASSLAARAADAVAVVTCCEANAGYIGSAVPADSLPPVHVIHHGVDLSRFAPAEQSPVAGGRPPEVTAIGRLVEKKGFDDLLRALALLARAGESFTCRIYGDGPQREQLTQLRDELGLGGCVHFMGARASDEVVAALASTDVFALTPRVMDDGDRDGIPNVLVEAMACGLPVLTTGVGGIPELVRHGVNGSVVPANDPPAVAEALQPLLRDPALRRRLGANGRRAVEADYDVAVAARRLRAIYRHAHALDVEVVP